MSHTPVGEEPGARNGTARRSAEASVTDLTNVMVEMQKVREGEKEADAAHRERVKALESLEKHMQEMQESYASAHDSKCYDLCRKHEEASQAAEKAEREHRERLQKEAELERLKEEHAQLLERKREVEVKIQRKRPVWNFMTDVLKMTTFKDIEAYTGYLGSLLHFREQLFEKYSEIQKLADLLRTSLVAMEDKHYLVQLENNNKLSTLQTNLDETLAELLIWESEWNQIREKAAKKTLLLGQIKMAALNLFEMAGEAVDDNNISMSDTEKQLDKVQLFIRDCDIIVKMYEAACERAKTAKLKRPTGTRSKKV
ncbi:coiled-coil domain-containing protein 42 isoform X2 [Betta splendens]|uniref:Coiled-coil domain-containing protein 42 isoform X1 n=1 Tax=Betta splendens TaxID=158456 RepID=A0A6P7NM67_BETSP|nr:coiled-coil domain-containing protein 42 isoform X1 [Betta splendens]XP_055367253.1 coiled-coil domain-containing protein 42 isoform X2 [Betta splendens]